MIENGTKYPQVTEIMKITDTAEGNGVYLLDLKIQHAEGAEPEEDQYLSRPDDPYGVNPQIRQWLSENPDAPVHEYVPRDSNVNEWVTSAPDDLTGGPSLAEIFGSESDLFPNR
jgi:hypothetical protein